MILLKSRRDTWSVFLTTESAMVTKFFRRLMIPLIISSVPQIRATKEQILNYYADHENGLENKFQAMADLITECHPRDGKPLCIGERLDDDLATHLYEATFTTIVSVASSKLIDKRYSEWMRGVDQDDIRATWKSGSFLLPASSPVDLKNQLDFVKNTPWWNSHGFFIFYEADDAVGGRCSNAYEFLSLAWNNGILSSVFLCQEQDGSLSMYSCNPYGNSAPQPWLMVREMKGLNGHPWNLFKWANYEGRGRSCGTIFFDKTRSLGGYPISTNAVSAVPHLYFNKSANAVDKYKGVDGLTMRVIWNFLNATIVDEPIPDEDAVLGWLYDNGHFRGSLKDVASGKVEIGINRMILRPMPMVTSTYPYSVSQFCFAVKDRGHIPWLLGLLLIFDRWTMVSGIAVFLTSTTMFGRFNGRGYFAEFLNTLRIFLSSSLVRTPGSIGLRMILCFVFLFPIVSYSTIQGKILSLIQNPLEYEDVESFDELLAKGYEIEGPEIVRSLLPVEEIGKNFVTNDLKGCLKKLYNDEPVACVDYCVSLAVKASYHEKLHIIRERSDGYPAHYVAKPDWPLVKRFNGVLQKLVEAGLVEHFTSSSLYEKLNTSSLYSDKSNDMSPLQITLDDFRYVFIGIAFGWAFAIVAFFGELIINRLKKLKIFRIIG